MDNEGAPAGGSLITVQRSTLDIQMGYRFGALMPLIATKRFK
jgi:hypothetical protein